MSEAEKELRNALLLLRGSAALCAGMLRRDKKPAREEAADILMENVLKFQELLERTK